MPASLDGEQLLAGVRHRIKHNGYAYAVTWLQSDLCSATPEAKAAALAQLGRENIAAVTITPLDLCGNRRRPGAWT